MGYLHSSALSPFQQFPRRHNPLLEGGPSAYWEGLEKSWPPLFPNMRWGDARELAAHAVLTHWLWIVLICLKIHI